ncbi:MAG: hypothetical protein ACE5J2_08505 [Nitrososphaerales archaeon]
MRRHKRRPEQKKKKITKWQLIIPVILGGAGVGIGLVVNLAVAGPPPLQQCIPTENMAFHLHTKINVSLNGEPFIVPADIGVTPSCVKPLHTHDTDGVIHTEFHKPIRFTLGGFIKLWGFDLNQYDFKIFAKGTDDPAFTEVTDYNALSLDDNLEIKIELTGR